MPDPLPERLELPSDLHELLFEAGDRIATLSGTGETLPNPDLLLRPLEDREAVESSELEGTHASPEELLLYSKDPKDPTSKHDRTNDWREVFNYRAALHEGWKQLFELPLSINVIKSMHSRLMSGVRGGDSTPGEIRRKQVGIMRGGEYKFIPPPHTMLIEPLRELEKYINAPCAPTQKLVRTFLAHYQFESIHPFGDGNGRIGRAVMSLMIYKMFGHRHPWVYLSPFLHRHKEEYYERLFRVSTHGEYGEWLRFCLKATIAQCNDSITRCEMLRRLRYRYLTRITGVESARTRLLIDELFKNATLGVAETRHKCKISYPTAKADIRILENAGILRQINGVSPITYYAWEIFRISFDQVPREATDEEVGMVIAESIASAQRVSLSSSVEPDSTSPPEPSRP